MDFRQFRYFIVTAEELHVARAAERLGIAQPALSQQIKALETRMGVRLFDRGKRRIELTEAGTAFLEEARAALLRAENAIRVAQDIARGEEGRIDIGIVGSAMYEQLFPQLLKSYRKAHPRVQVFLHERPIAAQINAVAAGQLDIAIVREPLPHAMPENLSHFVLSRQRLLIVLPAEHRLATADSVAMRDLAEDSFVAFFDPGGVGLGQRLTELGHASGFEPRIAQQVTEIGTLVSLVSAGFGVGLAVEVISHLRLPGVAYVPLDTQNPWSCLIVIHRRHERAATISALLDTIRHAADAK